MAELERGGDELDKWRDRAHRNPEDVQAHRALGLLLFRSGCLEESEQALSRTLSLNPDDSSSLSLLARIAERRKQPEIALGHWRAVNRLTPQDANAAFKVARACLNRGESDQAIDIIEAGLAASPGDDRLLLLAARASQAAGRLTQALGRWEALTEVTNHRFQAHQARGRIFLGFGRTDAAAVEFTKALAVRSDPATEELLKKCAPRLFEGILLPLGVARIRVSIIVAARNAADYLADALESVLAQTYPNWEAIVVDDGSTDETSAIAAAYSDRDARIRTQTVSAGSASVARNAGLAEASCEWVLFLDADDWMLPDGLQHLVTVLSSDASLDGVYGEAMRAATDGRILSNRQRPVHPAEFFEQSIIGHCIPIHTCIVRRSLVEGGGGFDPAFAVGEDWDLWLRLGRIGAKFAAVRHTVCCYRLRSNSSSFDIERGIADGLRIIRRAHEPDCRITVPQLYPDGGPLHGLPAAEAELVRDVATVAVYQITDPERLLDFVSPDSLAMIRPIGFISRSLADRCSDGTASRSPEFWETIVSRAARFFDRIEHRTGIAGLGKAAMRRHRREVCHLLDRGEPVCFGDTYGLRVDVGNQIDGDQVATTAGYAEVGVTWHGTMIDRLTLHPLKHVLSGDLIRRAVARHCGWKLLGHLFAATVYDRIKSRPDAGGSLWLDGICLGIGLGFQLDLSAPALHEKIGLTVFLDHLWRVASDARIMRASSDNVLVLDAADELTDVQVDRQTPVCIEMAIGGHTVRRFSICRPDDLITAGQLRRIMQGATTVHAMHVAVEKAICGLPAPLAMSLTNRLHQVGRQAGRRDSAHTRQNGGGARTPTSAPRSPEVLRSWRQDVCRGRTGLGTPPDAAHLVLSQCFTAATVRRGELAHDAGPVRGAVELPSRRRLPQHQFCRMDGCRAAREWSSGAVHNHHL